VRLLAAFDKLIVFITKASEEGGINDEGARIKRLLDVIKDGESCALLRLELALVVSVAKPLVESKYILEGNGPLALIAFETVIRIMTFFDVHKEEATWPGVPMAIDRYTRDIMNIRGGQEADEADILKSVIKELKDIVAPVEA
jgi:hypothetical protein